MSIVLDGTTGITTPGLTNTGTETLVNLTTTGNTTLGDASTDTLNVGNGGLIKDASGNVGIGVTPSAWRSTFKALQILGTATLSSNNNTTVYLGSNWYNNTSNQDVYTVTGAAGIYAISGGQHLWYNAPSGTAGSVATFTQAMTLDASGRLGIGVTAPAAPIHVLADSNGYSIRVKGRSSDSYGDISFNNNADTVNYAFLSANNAGTYFGTATALPLSFYTNNTEKARFDSSGRLIVGGSNVNGRIQSITPASYTESSFRADSATAASTNWNHFYGTSSSNSVANIIIYGNGNIVNANNSYGPISDIKLKENIVDATPKLDDLMKVRIVNYNLKTDPELKQIGVIAQELEQVFAGLVDQHPDRDTEGNDLGTTTKSVKMSVFIPILIKTIQEQQAIITTLTDRITALENK